MIFDLKDSLTRIDRVDAYSERPAPALRVNVHMNRRAAMTNGMSYSLSAHTNFAKFVKAS